MTLTAYLNSLPSRMCPMSEIPKGLDMWTDRSGHTTYYADNVAYYSSNPEHVAAGAFNCDNEKYMST